MPTVIWAAMEMAIGELGSALRIPVDASDPQQLIQAGGLMDDLSGCGASNQALLTRSLRALISFSHPVAQRACIDRELKPGDRYGPPLTASTFCARHSARQSAKPDS